MSLCVLCVFPNIIVYLQNLDDMDDVEEGKKELITREITQFREQMKVSFL